MRFSSRLEWILRPNPIAEAVRDKRAAGEPMLDLTESNPTHAGIEYPAGEIERAFADARILGYEPDPFGSHAVRECVAEYYGGAVAPDQIILTASTSEAYALLFKLLCDPGDEVLVPRPSYPLFEYLARLESVRVRQYPLFYDHGWHLDPYAIESAATERTRAVVLVNPNNPTGHFMKQREWDALAGICARHGMAVISDEVFADYGFSEDPERVPFVAGGAPVLAFSLNGLSKIVGLPQMKLGWMVLGGPAQDRHQARGRLEIIADTYLSVGTPVQVAAPTLLRMRHDILPRIRHRVLANMAYLQQTVAAESALTVLAAEGGWYATLRVPRTRSEEEWVLALLSDCDVLVQPGFFYDFESEAYLVLSLLTQPAVFQQGAARLLDSVHDQA